MSSTLLAPGESRTTAHGRYTIQASNPATGGHAVTTWSGPNRVDTLSFTTRDREVARLLYAVIAAAGEARQTPEATVEHLRTALTRALWVAADRHRNPTRVEAINTALDRLPPVDATTEAAMVAGITANMTAANTGEYRTDQPADRRGALVQLRDRYAAAARRERGAA